MYLKVVEEVLLLGLKQLPVGGVPQRLIPETAHINSGHLRVPVKYFEFYKIKLLEVLFSEMIKTLKNIIFSHLRILERLHINAPYTLISC